jgi:D-tyrosyl-tRNA(Tyr) deacylase
LLNPLDNELEDCKGNKRSNLKALLQRVAGASVRVEGNIIGEIDKGIVVFLGVDAEDTHKEADYLVEKIPNLRIFNDSTGKFNLSALDVTAGFLVISQFTLLADTRRGRRPSFISAAMPAKAEELYNYFINRIKETGLNVQTGSFGAHMIVKIINDGPVTIMLDSRDKYSA